MKLKKLKKGETRCLVCDVVIKSGNLQKHSVSKSHKEASAKKALKKLSSIPEISRMPDDFQPTVKIKTKTEQNRFDSEVEKLKKEIIKSSVGVFTVLGSKVYINNDVRNLIMISHNTEMIQCSEMFPLLDSKIQKVAVVCVKELLRLKGEHGNLKYLAADKKSIEYALKAYPKVQKIFWLIAIKTLLGERLITPNVERLKNVASLLGINKDHHVKKLIGKYKKDVDNQFRGQLDTDFDGKLLADDGEGFKHDGEFDSVPSLDLVNDGFDVHNAMEETMTSAPVRKRKKYSAVPVGTPRPKRFAAKKKK